MQPDQQQRIMGYFIEEAKDHLNTIEQGLLNLQKVAQRLCFIWSSKNIGQTDWERSNLQ